MLMQLLDEGYEFIFTRRFQSDPLENRFSPISADEWW